MRIGPLFTAVILAISQGCYHLPPSRFPRKNIEDVHILNSAIAGMALASVLTAGTTAYVPVCCDANSTVSGVGTSQNRVIGSFTAGPGSYAVAFPSFSTAWVTNPGDRTISIVSLPTNHVRKTINLTLTPWLIQASPDGAHVYVVTGMFTGNLQHYSSNVQEFDAVTGDVTGKVALPNDGLMNPGLAVSRDGARVYATFDSQTIVVYDVASGTAADTWQTTRALTWIATGTLTLSPDGGTLYTAGQVLTALDTTNGHIRGTVNPPGPPQSYSFVGSAVSADGKTLYASYAAQIGTGAGLAAIDATSLTIIRNAPLGSELLQPVLAKDGATLYVPDSIDSRLYVVNAADLTAKSSVALQGPIHAATLNANGSALAVPNASTASALAVDTTSMAVVASIGVSGTGNPQADKFGTTNASAQANGSRVFVGGVEANSISTINPATNKVARTYSMGALSPSVTGTNSPGIMATPNGRQIYLLGSDYQPEMTEIDTATGAVNGVPCPIGLGCWVTNMAALPDSSRVYLAGFGFGVIFNPPFFFVVDTITKTIVAAPRIRDFGAMAVSPSGTFMYIATGSGISKFNTLTNTIVGTLAISGVTAIAFSPDGSTGYAAAGSVLYVISTGSNEVIDTINLGRTNITALAVSPDGSQIWVTSTGSTSVEVVNILSRGTQTVDFGLTVSGGVAFGTTP